MKITTATVVLPVLFVLGITTLLMMTMVGTGSSGTSTMPSDAAVSDIPAPYLELYVSAGQQYHTDWWVLAGIGKVETNHGRSTQPGVTSGVNAFGCCAGPMQFAVSPAAGCRVCVGDTWGAYAVDGNHDGTKNVYDPADAIPTAARYTNANGAPHDWHKALLRYNNSQAYYDEVMTWAQQYKAAGTSSAGTTIGSVDPVALVHNPNIHFWHPCEENDILTGQIDPRLLAALDTIAKTTRIGIYALKCDHSLETSTGNVSNHSFGRAADISDVDGEACTGTRTGKCGKLAIAFSGRRDALMPTESIYCFDPDPSRADAWAQADHCDHWHLSYQ